MGPRDLVGSQMTKGASSRNIRRSASLREAFFRKAMDL